MSRSELEIRLKSDEGDTVVSVPWEPSLEPDEYWHRMIRPALMSLKACAEALGR